MKWGAHGLVALGAASIVLGEVSRLALPPASPIAISLFFAGGIFSTLLGSILPDMLDFAFSPLGARHRNSATHGIPSLIIPILLGGFAFVLVLSYLPALILLGIAVWLCLPLGWVSHLLLGALTPSGIPLPSGPFSWDWAPYDSPAGNRVMKVFGASNLVAGFLTVVDPVCPLFIPLVGALWASRWRADKVRERDLIVKVLTTDNVEVVATLTAIAQLWERMQDQPRAIAFRKAAMTIRNLRWSLKENYTRLSIEELPFVGRTMAGIIKDTLGRRQCRYLDWLYKEYLDRSRSLFRSKQGRINGNRDTCGPPMVPTRETRMRFLLSKTAGIIT